MRLYHFSTMLHLESLVENGIIGGMVDAGDSIVHGQWLTDDPDPMHQQWASVPGLTYLRANKAEVRLTVEIPDGDPNLIRWVEHAENTQVPRWWRDALNHTGGGHEAHWWVYLGTIPPEWVVDGHAFLGGFEK